MTVFKIDDFRKKKYFNIYILNNTLLYLAEENFD